MAARTPTLVDAFVAAVARSVAQAARSLGRRARIVVRPEWVGILDFETRLPSALARRMGSAK